MYALDLLDLLIRKWSKTPKPLPRPWDAAERKLRLSRVKDPKRLEAHPVKWKTTE